MTIFVTAQVKAERGRNSAVNRDHKRTGMNTVG